MILLDSMYDLPCLEGYRREVEIAWGRNGKAEIIIRWWLDTGGAWKRISDFSAREREAEYQDHLQRQADIWWKGGA